jgi:hypothetical protein
MSIKKLNKRLSWIWNSKLPKNAANGQISVVMQGRTLKNELIYNRETWAEWASNPSNAITKDSSGLTITQDGTSYLVVYLNDTKYKDNTKYGLLINFVQVENKPIQLVAGGPSSLGNTADHTIKTLGNNKIIFTTGTIANNRQHIYIPKENTGTWKFRDIRVFELPAGSEIESDFEAMTADQLATKYPYISGDYLLLMWLQKMKKGILRSLEVYPMELKMKLESTAYRLISKLS